MKKYMTIIVLGLVSYLLFADVVYAFRHPEMTDTQRVLHGVDVIMFK